MLSANAVNASEPSINQTAAACATTDESGAGEHRPLAAREHDDSERNAELRLDREQSEREACEPVALPLERQPAGPECGEQDHRHLTVEHETPERWEGRGRSDEECPIRQQMRDWLPDAPHDQRVPANREETPDEQRALV